MTRWILLLRGINMFGRNSLPMKELVQILERLGLLEIRTYIQSGNVVFSSPEPTPPDLRTRIAREIEKRRGFRPRMLLLSRSRLEKAIALNPFPEAEEKPKTLHLYFLTESAEGADPQALSEIASPDERFEFIDRILYLHTPNGVGGSRLAANAEKYLGVSATARNWRTVQKLWEILPGER